MFADRDTKFDLLALGLLLLVAFLAVALLTYDPADPLVELVYPLNRWIHHDLLSYPLNESIANACGPWGALASALLLQALGLGAYYAVGSLGVLTVLLLLRREISSPVLRTIGWLMSLVGFTTIVALAVTGISPGSMLGPGGSLGALISTIFRVHFATIGGFLLAVTLFLGGLLLCTDYVLVHAGLMLGSLTVAGLMGIRGESEAHVNRRATGSHPANNDETDRAREAENLVAVRVGGRQIVRPESEAPEHESAGESDSELEQESDEAWDEDYDSDEDPVVEDEEEAELSITTPPRGSLMGGTMAAAAAAARRGRRRLAALRVPAPESEHREVVMQQLDEASEREDQSDYELPSIDLLLPGDEFSFEQQAVEVRNKAKILEKTFQSFGFNVKVVEIETGPVIAQYEVELESGLRLSKITGLADDLAIALRVPSVRIVAPIPGKNTVGIEVPNDERQLVRLREVMEESVGKTKKMRIPVFLGQDVSGNPLTVDLAAMPHLLIAGRTGTGKSVCLNAIITSILMTRKPDEVRMLMIDPKMVELSGYKSLPHLMHPVVTEMRKAEAILAWAVDKMEERYALLAQAGVRHLAGYNQLSREELLSRIQPENDDLAAAVPTHMPYIVIVADEIADMMMTAGKDVEQHIIRLAQKSRAVGIHLILATQKPTVDVITGLIKSNLPARVAFQVASRTDSRVVLDEMGADRLLGNGDMLFLWPGTSTLLRGQGTFVSDEEINAVVAAVSTGEQNFVTELVDLKVEDTESDQAPGSLKKRDELYERAIEIVVTEGRGSVSLLQRALGIGYGRAARLIDFMAEDGIVGSYAGSQAREVLVSMADVRQMIHGGTEEAGPPPPQHKSKSPTPPDSAPDRSLAANTPARGDRETLQLPRRRGDELEADQLRSQQRPPMPARNPRLARRRLAIHNGDRKLVGEEINDVVSDRQAGMRQDRWEGELDEPIVPTRRGQQFQVVHVDGDDEADWTGWDAEVAAAHGTAAGDEPQHTEHDRLCREDGLSVDLEVLDEAQDEEACADEEDEPCCEDHQYDEQDWQEDPCEEEEYGQEEDYEAEEEEYEEEEEEYEEEFAEEQDLEDEDLRDQDAWELNADEHEDELKEPTAEQVDDDSTEYAPRQDDPGLKRV